MVEPFDATVRKEVPLELATAKRLSVEPDTPCRVKRFWGVVVPIPTLLKAVTLKMEFPVEEETLKGSRVVLPWTLKEIVDELALMPATAPLSIKAPWAKAEADVHLAAKPLAPVPVTVPWNWSVEAMVICPTVLVVMVMLEPLIKVMGAYLTPLESAPKSWPCWVGAVDVPVPPLATESCPVKPGTKVKVLAVVVLMLTVMLASEVVATWMAGPVKAEMEVRAEVK